jgi:hypothetical protein
MSYEEELATAMDKMIGQVVIALVKQAGGELSIPVEEIDDTTQDILMIKVVDTTFHFKVVKKN